MASVVIAGNTSGSITLDAPAVAGTTTLTLPATTGTFITTTGGVAPGSSGNVLTSNGTAWTSAAPSGGVTSLNGNTGALKGMTLLSTTNFSSATTIDITNIPTTAGTTYILQIQGFTPNNGSLTQTVYSLRYSTNNGSTFATTAISSATPTYASNTTVSTYMGDVIWTTGSTLSYTQSFFSQVVICNGGSVNGGNCYPNAFSAVNSGDYENGETYGRFYISPDPLADFNNICLVGAGTVRGATFNALRIIRRTGNMVVSGNVKLFVLGV